MSKRELPPIPPPSDRSPMAGPAYFDHSDMDRYGRKCADDAYNNNEWAELWYFVMDEAAAEFEKIVTTCSPSTWMQEAHKLMRENK